MLHDFDIVDLTPWLTVREYVEDMGMEGTRVKKGHWYVRDTSMDGKRVCKGHGV